MSDESVKNRCTIGINAWILFFASSFWILGIWLDTRNKTTIFILILVNIFSMYNTHNHTNTQIQDRLFQTKFSSVSAIAKFVFAWSQASRASVRPRSIRMTHFHKLIKTVDLRLSFVVWWSFWCAAASDRKWQSGGSLAGSLCKKCSVPDVWWSGCVRAVRKISRKKSHKLEAILRLLDLPVHV